jgi:hypothetical protein
MIFGALPGASAPRIVQQPINVQSDVAGLLVTPAQYPVLLGAVKVEGGAAAVPRLRVVLRSASPAIQSPAAQSGADGAFNFGPVSPGRYVLQFPALPPGAYIKAAKLGDKDALAGLDLSQPTSDARLEVTVSYAGARIDGVVLDQQGKPAEGVACLIPDPPQPGMPWLYQTAEAVEDGVFHFQGVRPGMYRVYAWEELEPGAYMDPQFTAQRQANSVAIEVAENEKKQISIKRIPVDAQ